MTEQHTDNNNNPFIARLVFQLAKKIERHGDRYLRRVAQIGVHDWRLLVYIYDYKVARLSEIAQAMNYDPAHMQIMANSLCSRHYARMVETPDGPGVVATSIGEGIYQTILPYMVERQKKLRSVFDDAEFQQMRTLLGKLSVHVDGLLEEQKRHSW